MAKAAVEAAQNTINHNLIKEVDTLLAEIRGSFGSEEGAIACVKQMLDNLLSDQAAAEALRDAHVNQDIVQRAAVNSLGREGKRLWNAYVGENSGGATDTRAFDGVLFVHNDDKSKINVPHMAQQGTTDGLTKWCQGVNGNYNLVTEDMLFNFPEQGVTGKDTSFVVDTVLLAVSQMCRGEKVGAVVLDCAITNTSTMVAAYLPVLMVKLGVVESFVVMFFQKYHSKSYCDKLFGALEILLGCVVAAGCRAFFFERDLGSLTHPSPAACVTTGTTQQ